MVFSVRSQMGASLRLRAESSAGRPSTKTIQANRQPGVLTSGTRVGEYRVVELLTSGGMSQIYKAVQTSLDRQVVLKVLRSRYHLDSHRFANEVRMSGRMNHPNIVSAIDAGEVAGVSYLAMAYIDGVDLGDMLADGPMAEADVVRVMVPVAEALQYAWNDHHILHRDIKPANIMVAKSGMVKLLDLGISKCIEEDLNITAVGDCVGTPDYMSPEQCMGRLDIDQRSDIYAFGATIYHLLTGQVPFTGPSPLAIINHHVSTPLVPLSTVNESLSPQISQLVEWMMAKDQADRPADWGIVVEHLRALEQGDAPTPITGVQHSPLPESVTGPARAPTSVLSLPTFRPRVLVIDDDPAFAEFVRLALVKDAEVEVCNSAIHALDVVPRFLPDIILLDHNMPNMTGLEFLELIRGNREMDATRVLIISGDASDERMLAAQSLGADDFIRKPFSAAHIQFKIRTWVPFTRACEVLALRSSLLTRFAPRKAGDSIDLGDISELGNRYEMLEAYVAHRMRPSRPIPQPLKVAQIFEPILDNYRQMCAARPITMGEEIDGNLTVMGNADYLQQVFSWLLDNAVGHAEDVISISCFAGAHSQVYFHVIDDGPGFDGRVLPYVFAAFRAGADRDSEGHSPCGHLSLARLMLHDLDGTIDIVDPGPGSTIIQVTLSLVAGYD
jgi:serine/threonine-protein kinase